MIPTHIIVQYIIMLSIITLYKYDIYSFSCVSYLFVSKQEEEYTFHPLKNMYNKSRKYEFGCSKMRK